MPVNPLLRVSGEDAPPRGDEAQPSLASNPYANTPAAMDYENGWQYAQEIGSQQLTLAEDDTLARWKNNSIPWRQGLADAAKAMGVPGIAEALDPAAAPPAQPQMAFPTTKSAVLAHPVARTLAWGAGTAAGGLLGGGLGITLSDHLVPEGSTLGISHDTLEKGVAAVPAALGAGAGGFVGEALSDRQKQKVLMRLHTDPAALPTVVGLPTKSAAMTITDAKTGNPVEVHGSFQYGDGSTAYIGVDDHCYTVWVSDGQGAYNQTSHLWKDAVEELKTLPSDPDDLVAGQPGEILPGGLAEGSTNAQFPPAALNKGTEVEQEHTDAPAVASEIARDHLAEDPDYYDKLEKMEKGAAAEHMAKLADVAGVMRNAWSATLPVRQAIVGTAIRNPSVTETLGSIPDFATHQARHATTGLLQGARSAVRTGTPALNNAVATTKNLLSSKPSYHNYEIIPDHPSGSILHPPGTQAAMAAGKPQVAPPVPSHENRSVPGVRPDMRRPTEQLIAQSTDMLDDIQHLRKQFKMPMAPVGDPHLLDNYVRLQGTLGSSHPDTRRAYLAYQGGLLDANRHS